MLEFKYKGSRVMSTVVEGHEVPFASLEFLQDMLRNVLNALEKKEGESVLFSSEAVHFLYCIAGNSLACCNVLGSLFDSTKSAQETLNPALEDAERFI